MRIAPPQANPEFETKRKMWHECLHAPGVAGEGSDRNAIWTQIHELIWASAAWRLVNESRRFATKDARGRLKIHALTHWLLDQGYFQTQMLGIRRLLDAEKSGPEGRRGVYSLRWVVKDMQKHRALLSRSNVFAFWELPLDTNAVRDRSRAVLAEHMRKGLLPESCEDYEDPYHAERLHKEMDALCGVEAACRSPRDEVQARWFDVMMERLDALDGICGHVDKFLAHAATPQSRKELTDPESNRTLGELQRAHEVLVRVCSFVDCPLVSKSSMGVLAIPPHDVFLHAEQPLLGSESTRQLQKIWKDYEELTASWPLKVLDWLDAPSGGGGAGVPSQPPSVQA